MYVLLTDSIPLVYLISTRKKCMYAYMSELFAWSTPNIISQRLMRRKCVLAKNNRGIFVSFVLFSKEDEYQGLFVNTQM